MEYRNAFQDGFLVQSNPVPFKPVLSASSLLDPKSFTIESEIHIRNPSYLELEATLLNPFENLLLGTCAQETRLKPSRVLKYSFDQATDLSSLVLGDFSFFLFGAAS